MEEAVRRWRQLGLIYFWFEPDKRQGDGWHLAADPTGCSDLEKLTDLARTSRYPSRFKLIPVPIPGFRVPKEVLINYSKEWIATHWSLEARANQLVLEVGSEGLAQLGEAVANLRSGDGDYTIGGEVYAERIWVWWPPRR